MPLPSEAPGHWELRVELARSGRVLHVVEKWALPALGPTTTLGTPGPPRVDVLTTLRNSAATTR